MGSAKKRAAPRQVFVVLGADGEPSCAKRRKRDAVEWLLEGEGERVVGPYVLAERRAER
jgi:hypothetical protein